MNNKEWRILARDPAFTAETARGCLHRARFKRRREGYTRCVVCHSAEGANGYLQPLSPGATTWDQEQSRRNFEAVSRLVVPGEPLKSRLLLHPLEPAAGGDEFHNGGRQFTSQNDQRFQTIAAWVRGQTAGGSGK